MLGIFPTLANAARPKLKVHLSKGAHEEVRWLIGRHHSVELASVKASFWKRKHRKSLMG
jgi:hypothetical protein